jgi:RNase P/RNase MRP subunit p30
MLVDVFVPENNEVELANEAMRLGFKEIVLLYEAGLPKKPSIPGLRIRTALLIRSLNDCVRAKKHFDLLFAPSDRPFFESAFIDCILLEVYSPAPDLFFQRRSGLDDVKCALAKKNNIQLVFATKISDKSVLGRLEQDARLCRKYKLAFSVASFARKPRDLRAQKDLEAYARVLKLL